MVSQFEDLKLKSAVSDHNPMTPQLMAAAVMRFRNSAFQSPEALSRAYRSLAVQIHPDKNRANVDLATANMQAATEAYNRGKRHFRTPNLSNTTFTDSTWIARYNSDSMYHQQFTAAGATNCPLTHTPRFPPGKPPAITIWTSADFLTRWARKMVAVAVRNLINMPPEDRWIVICRELNELVSAMATFCQTYHEWATIGLPWSATHKNPSSVRWTHAFQYMVQMAALVGQSGVSVAGMLNLSKALPVKSSVPLISIGLADLVRPDEVTLLCEKGHVAPPPSADFKQKRLALSSHLTREYTAAVKCHSKASSLKYKIAKLKTTHAQLWEIHTRLRKQCTEQTSIHNYMQLITKKISSIDAKMLTLIHPTTANIHNRPASRAPETCAHLKSVRRQLEQLRQDTLRKTAVPALIVPKPRKKKKRKRAPKPPVSIACDPVPVKRQRVPAHAAFKQANVPLEADPEVFWRPKDWIAQKHMGTRCQQKLFFANLMHEPMFCNTARTEGTRCEFHQLRKLKTEDGCWVSVPISRTCWGLRRKRGRWFTCASSVTDFTQEVPVFCDDHKNEHSLSLIQKRSHRRTVTVDYSKLQ